MIGISWGGFNGLQVAARRPRQLKAVVSIASTDDRYADDIHFMGGCLLLDKAGWYSTMFSLNACPPDPAVVGPRWRALWEKRLDESGFWLKEWLSHQRRDAFWKHGSVCENYDDIETPVLAVGGWADGYSNTVFRLLANLKAPVRGLVGPWAHKYPHFAKPGPQIGFLQECVRWFDHWLKGLETGVMDDPLLRVYIEDPIRPAPYNPVKPGRWVGETHWPPKRARMKAFGLSRAGLGEGGDDVLSIGSPQTTGLAAGKWCPYGSWADQALDQRQEQGGQLVFDTVPLAAPVEVLGAPELTLDVAADRPAAFVAVTLCEVFPDGAATRISYGLLNLTHRKGHEKPKRLKPGKRYRVKVKLNDCGHRFGEGNRIRVAVSNAYWPTVWPSPEPAILSLYCERSRLHLPVRHGRGDIEVSLPPPDSSPPLVQTQLEAGRNTWTTSDDIMTGETVLERINDAGVTRIEGTGLDMAYQAVTRFRIKADDPLSARLETHVVRRYGRGDWQVEIDTRLTMSCTATDFVLDAALEARHGGEVVRKRTFSERIARDHV
jgi:putative CocE/NonD family hydrolase